MRPILAVSPACLSLRALQRRRKLLPVKAGDGFAASLLEMTGGGTTGRDMTARRDR
jgi:hypothetical protein